MFTCGVRGGPIPTITWTKNNHTITREQYLSRKYFLQTGITLPSTIYTGLTIRNTNPSDIADYSCIVSNTQGSISSTATLSVHVRPSVSVMNEAYTAREQSSVSFQCIGTGIPAPDIKWYKSGNLIMASSTVTLSNSVYLNESTMIHVVTSTFSIAQVSLSDSDTNYTCSASNPAGIDFAQFELNVIGEWIPLQ